MNGWRGSRVNRIFWLIHGKQESLFLARPAKIENVGDIAGCDNYNYIISSAMHAFWLVLTYDLLEDRRIDDVVIKNFLFLYYIKQIDSPCVCSVIDQRGRQNVVEHRWHTRRSQSQRLYAENDPARRVTTPSPVNLCFRLQQLLHSKWTWFVISSL